MRMQLGGARDLISGRGFLAKFLRALRAILAPLSFQILATPQGST